MGCSFAFADFSIAYGRGIYVVHGDRYGNFLSAIVPVAIRGAPDFADAERNLAVEAADFLDG